VTDWQEWIGRTTSASARFDPEPANLMSVTLDREPTFAEGDLLPPGWHWIYFHEMIRSSELGADGHPRLGLTMPPIELSHRMWAGGHLAFHAPIVLGTTVTRTSTIQSITPKAGRSGELFFVKLEHELRSGAALCLREEQTIVYRDRPSSAPPSTGPRAPNDTSASAEWKPESTMLFRYSALTFNSHRIHYDADFCRDVEGYPGPVVHGPLIATLLLDLAVREHRPLGQFTCRALHPLFLSHRFTANARSDGDVTHLWVADHEGRLAMEAEASAIVGGDRVVP
jgi:3-methylfumaryl-CoA hydratase